jgi:hypothetical protein
MSATPTSTLLSSGTTDGEGPLVTGDTGVVGCPGVMQHQKGTDSSAAPAVLTPSFASGTAAQLSDTSRDYMVYLAITTSGTATSVAIGPTSTPANTILPSSSVTAGQLISFRLPAGWYVKWAGTTTAIATQTAIGC